jgi:hypothetical protein
LFIIIIFFLKKQLNLVSRNDGSDDKHFLKKLNLKQTNLNDFDCIKIFEKLKLNKTLQVLNMSANHFEVFYFY